MESNADKDDLMVEAAETLAGLACGSAVRDEASGSTEQPLEELRVTYSGSTSQRLENRFCLHQDDAIGLRQFCGNTSTTTVVTGVLETNNQTVSIVPSQLCSTSYNQPNATTKSRQTLTETEKEARRIRRILANRESARQTIRRRQAMYVEFTKRAADLANENQSLKKEKERAEKEYTSLKNKNEFLKLQMSELREAELRGRQEKPESTDSSNDPPQFLSYDHPVLVPFIWPSVVHPDIIRYSANSGSRNPMLVLPVPCLLPYAPSNENSFRASSNYHRSSSSYQTLSMGASKSSTPLNPNLNPAGRHSQGNLSDVPNITPQKGLLFTGIWRHKTPEEVVVATKARRRRKELMRMKDIRFQRPN